MRPQEPGGMLDERRGWARLRAVVTCLVGIGVIAFSAAMLGLVLLAAVARFVTWVRGRSIDSTGLWGFAGETALGVGGFAVTLSFAIVFWWFWTNAGNAVLTEVNATRVDKPHGKRHRRTMNVLEELSIGLGRPVPELWVVDHVAPNALSVRSSKRQIICATSGVTQLSRDELEAMLAHELGHLWARDARWVGSGMVALARGRRAGLILMSTGAVMSSMLLTSWRKIGILWSTTLFAVALMLLGLVCMSLLRRLEMDMRRRADVIADVAAVRLTRNPGSLAALCARLAEDDRVVSTASWRSELMWFEMVEAADLVGDKDPKAVGRTRAELVKRALAAYAEARTPIPPEFRTRFDQWLADHPTA